MENLSPHFYDCLNLSMPVPSMFHFQRTVRPPDSGTGMNFSQKTCFLVKKLPLQYHFSAHSPDLLTPCLHLHISALSATKPYCPSNNASLVPGKPTWCAKMLCNTKWLLPPVLLNNGKSSRISFMLCQYQCMVVTFSISFKMKQTTSIIIHIWGLFCLFSV